MLEDWENCKRERSCASVGPGGGEEGLNTVSELLQNVVVKRQTWHMLYLIRI